MKSSVYSYDVFDTLIARNVEKPTDIFNIIEKNKPYLNFKELRIESEKINGKSLTTIYKEFQKLTNETDEKIEELKNFEIQTEINNSYLIMTNVNLVKDGDILISDMYLSNIEIYKILNSLGFNKNVTIFSSSIGISKSNGLLYLSVLNDFDIKLHTGDNIYSDVYMANLFNIPSQLTTLHSINSTEQFFIKNINNHFGFLLRKFRLQNPYVENSLEFKLYNDQAIINIPLLVLISFYLQLLLINENRTTILFATRDSCLLKIIFETLFPYVSVKSYQVSRIVNKTANKEYENYLLKLYDHSTCIIFDGHGSFNSGRKLFINIFNLLPRIHIFSLANYKNLYFKDLTYNIKHGNNNFELFNVDTVGSLIDLKNGNFIRDEITGYKKENAEIYKDTIHRFCLFINKENNSIMNLFNNVDIHSIIIKFNDAIYKNASSNIIENIDDFFNNDFKISSKSNAKTTPVSSKPSINSTPVSSKPSIKSTPVSYISNKTMKMQIF